MRVRVLFFGILREIAGKTVDDIELPQGVSVRELIARYEGQIPQLREWVHSIAIAVNDGGGSHR